MKGRITPQSIERVRDATDIVQVVSAYVSLKRSGRGFSGLCPFHAEKTPSFHVAPDRGRYKCFGCNVSGNAIDFVMAIDKVEFVEAVEVLAARAGVILEREQTLGGPDQDKPVVSKLEIYRVNKWAAQVFQRALNDTSGAECRAYLAKRGLTAESIREFRLGFAPPSWDWLVRRAQKQNVPVGLLVQAGLAKERDNGEKVDMFRNRLMFPIVDTLDRVIAFGGRTLDGADPKYLNSPETPVFLKRRSFYGADRVKAKPSAEPIFVMEGYTDVILAAQNGNRGAVATLGTSLSEDHAKILTRFACPVILVYDGDAAGRRAAERGAAVFAAADLDLRVSVLEGNEDPCDFYLRVGPSGTRQLVEGAIDFFEFVQRQVTARHDLATVAGQTRVAEDLLRLAAAARNPVKRSLILERISRLLGLRLEDLQSRLTATTFRDRSSPRDPREESTAVATPPTVQLPNKRRIAENTTLRALFRFGFQRRELTAILSEDFHDPTRRHIFDILKCHADKGGAPGDIESLLLGVDESRVRQEINQLAFNESGDDLTDEKIALDAAFLVEERRRLNRLAARLAAKDDNELLKHLLEDRRITRKPVEAPRIPEVRQDVVDDTF